MNTVNKINRFLAGLPTHVVVIAVCLLWLLPAFGLLVTSLRPFQDINDTGWWTVLSAPKGMADYTASCAACHGDDGKLIATADLTDPELIGKYPRSLQLMAMLRKEIDGKPHMEDLPAPEAQQAADIANYLRRISNIENPPRFTASNYVDALVATAAPPPTPRTAPRAPSRWI